MRENKVVLWFPSEDIYIFLTKGNLLLSGSVRRPGILVISMVLTTFIYLDLQSNPGAVIKQKPVCCVAARVVYKVK